MNKFIAIAFFALFATVAQCQIIGPGLLSEYGAINTGSGSSAASSAASSSSSSNGAGILQRGAIGYPLGGIGVLGGFSGVGYAGLAPAGLAPVAIPVAAPGIPAIAAPYGPAFAL